MSIVQEKTNRRNILLVAVTRLGDMLQATPTIAGLKKENPGCRITVVIEKSFASICKYLPGIDEVYELDLAYLVRCMAREGDGLVEAYKYVDKVAADLKAQEFDYCLNMSSSGYTALLITLLNLKESRGWVSDEQGRRHISTPWARLFAAIIFHGNREYNSINIVDFFRCSAGVTSHPNKLLYEVADSARDFCDSFIKEKFTTNEGPLICIQAGASQTKRQWSPFYFARLAQILIEEQNARIVFTGSKSERDIIETITSIFNHPNIVNAAGETDLAELGALLERSDILITGDTGPMHLSVAVGTPVISLFLASAVGFETGPYGPGHILLQPQITCHPCNPNYSCGRPDCHQQITPELVAYVSKIRLQHKGDDLSGVVIPKEIAPSNEVAVYATTFDEDNFLDLINLNGESEKKGFSRGFFDVARQSYRSLWKEEFVDIPAVEVDTDLTIDKFPFQTGLSELIELSNEGIQLTSRLVELVKDVNSSPPLLGEVTGSMAILDQRLDEFGFRESFFGTLLRMFTMERDNMMEEEPLELVTHKKMLYEILQHRAKRLSELFLHYSE